MKKFLSVSCTVLFLASLSVTVLAQVQPSFDPNIQRPQLKVLSAVAPDEKDVRILPYPDYDPYKQEIERLRNLDLQTYAGNIADELIKQLSWEKAYRDLNEQFWGKMDYYADFTVPTKDEVLAAVYETVQQLGGSAVPEALVGVIADEIAAPVYAVLQALDLTDAQRQLVGIQDPKNLTQESLAINAIYQIKNNVWQTYRNQIYVPVNPVEPILYKEPIDLSNSGRALNAK